MNIGELVRRAPVSCRPQTPIENVGDQMRRAGVGSVMVVDEHDRLVGIVTDRDLFIRHLQQGTHHTTSVDQVMTTDITYAYETDDVFDCATLMATRPCRRLPILTTGGTVKGIVTLDDLLVVFAEQVDKLARTVRLEMGRVTNCRADIEPRDSRRRERAPTFR